MVVVCSCLPFFFRRGSSLLLIIIVRRTITNFGGVQNHPLIISHMHIVALLAELQLERFQKGYNQEPNPFPIKTSPKHINVPRRLPISL